MACITRLFINIFKCMIIFVFIEKLDSIIIDF